MHDARMRILQQQTDRHAVLLRTLTDRTNAVYGSFDRMRRFNLRAYNCDRFGAAIALGDRRSAVTIDDMTTWGVAADAEREARERDEAGLDGLKKFVQMWQWTVAKRSQDRLWGFYEVFYGFFL